MPGREGQLSVMSAAATETRGLALRPQSKRCSLELELWPPAAPSTAGPAPAAAPSRPTSLPAPAPSPFPRETGSTRSSRDNPRSSTLREGSRRLHSNRRRRSRLRPRSAWKRGISERGCRRGAGRFVIGSGDRQRVLPGERTPPSAGGSSADLSARRREWIRCRRQIRRGGRPSARRRGRSNRSGPARATPSGPALSFPPSRHARRAGPGVAGRGSR